jgi:hypothetical protein
MATWKTPLANAANAIPTVTRSKKHNDFTSFWNRDANRNERAALHIQHASIVGSRLASPRPLSIFVEKCHIDSRIQGAQQQ